MSIGETDMSTKVLTKTQKVYNMLATGKAVKLSTAAKKLYGSDDATSQDNARRIITQLKNTSDLDIELVSTGTYKAS